MNGRIRDDFLGSTGYLLRCLDRLNSTRMWENIDGIKGENRGNPDIPEEIIATIREDKELQKCLYSIQLTVLQMHRKVDEIKGKNDENENRYASFALMRINKQLLPLINKLSSIAQSTESWRRRSANVLLAALYNASLGALFFCGMYFWPAVFIMAFSSIGITAFVPMLYIALTAGGIGAVVGFIEGCYGLFPGSLLSFLRSPPSIKENSKWQFHFLKSPIRETVEYVSRCVHDINGKIYLSSLHRT